MQALQMLQRLRNKPLRKLMQLEMISTWFLRHSNPPQKLRATNLRRWECLFNHLTVSKDALRPLRNYLVDGINKVTILWSVWQGVLEALAAMEECNSILEIHLTVISLRRPATTRFTCPAVWRVLWGKKTGRNMPWRKPVNGHQAVPIRPARRPAKFMKLMTKSFIKEAGRILLNLWGSTRIGRNIEEVTALVLGIDPQKPFPPWTQH